MLVPIQTRCFGRLNCFFPSITLSQNFLSTLSYNDTLDITDLRCPHSWYPLARKKKRNVILHVGPTNSGKTHNALKRLELSYSGIYCGPLRLLAWEVAGKLNRANVPCSLITGQERVEVDHAKHKAVTVEMADVTKEYKCAVIDEIQMVGCVTRGFSFTRALLGLAVDELHLCGDPAVVPLIQRIFEVTGDILQVKHYERLSPLIASKKPLVYYANIRKGDCIVAFSRRHIYKIKKQIESETKHLCSVVYGSLPPETRTRQARMFNDAKSDFDVLVASDAVGMGLNLNIHRIIFSTLEKFDGESYRPLTVPEIKQIAGRAGRYGSMFPNGEVTCMPGNDIDFLHSSLHAPSPLVEAAGLFPTYELLALYSRLHPRLKFKSILSYFIENAELSSNYFLVNCDAMLDAADVIDDLPLQLQEKYLFCTSPIDMDDEICVDGLVQFAQEYVQTGRVHMKKIFIPGKISMPANQTELIQLESIHKVLDLYVWLSFRMESSFPDRELATSQKELCCMLIEEYLEKVGTQPHTRPSKRRKKIGRQR